MEIQQEFIYDVFWEQQLVSVEACLFLFFIFWQTEKESLLSTEARKGKKIQTDKKKQHTSNRKYPKFIKKARNHSLPMVIHTHVHDHISP